MPYGGNPAGSNTDAVRMLIRDTSTSPLLTDNEVAYLVANNANVYYAAAAGADMIAGGKSDAVVQKKVDGLSLLKGNTQGGVAALYRDLADSLRLQAVRRGVKPYAGGISITDKDSQLSDSDWDRTEIRLGMHDNPPVSESTY